MRSASRDALGITYDDARLLFHLQPSWDAECIFNQKISKLKEQFSQLHTNQMVRSKVLARRNQRYVVIPEFMVESLQIEPGSFVSVWQDGQRIVMER
jgi:hypothetical protein